MKPTLQTVLLMATLLSIILIAHTLSLAQTRAKPLFRGETVKYVSPDEIEIGDNHYRLVPPAPPAERNVASGQVDKDAELKVLQVADTQARAAVLAAQKALDGAKARQKETAKALRDFNKFTKNMK